MEKIEATQTNATLMKKRSTTPNLLSTVASAGVGTKSSAKESDVILPQQPTPETNAVTPDQIHIGAPRKDMVRTQTNFSRKPIYNNP